MRSRYSLVFILALVVAFGAACSSKKARTDGDAGMAPGVESSADKVGSIPEDMMGEELGMGDSSQSANAPSSEGASVSAGTETGSKSDDPFADLTQESESKTDTAATKSQATDMAIEAGDTKSMATTGNMETYKVKAGDTLMKIAFTIYGDVDRWNDLFSWNRDVLKKASRLHKGMQLKYETPVEAFHREKLAHSYVIKKGDTLANIADDVYGRKAKYKKLQKYNSNLIKNPNVIFAGFTLYYDITPQEMAEAEARRKEKLAGGTAAPSPAPAAGDAWAHPATADNGAAPAANVPSAVNPPNMDAAQPAPVASGPTPPAANPPAPSSVAPTGGGAAPAAPPISN